MAGLGKRWVGPGIGLEMVFNGKIGINLKELQLSAAKREDRINQDEKSYMEIR
jgi:hypothetical protein